jgi:hypothetical protein
MAESRNHELGGGSSKLLPALKLHWTVEVLRTLPRGMWRVVVVLTAILTAAAVVIAACWRAGELVSLGGVTAGVFASCRRYLRALRVARGAS